MYDSFEYIIESAQQQQQQQQVDSLPQRQRHHSGRKLEGRTSESRAAEGRRPVERQAPEPVPAKSCCRLGNRHMLVMAIGLFVLGAAISFGIWAATGGFYRPTTTPLEDGGIRRVLEVDAPPPAPLPQPATTPRPTTSRRRTTSVGRTTSTRRPPPTRTNRRPPPSPVVVTSSVAPVTSATPRPAVVRGGGSFFDLPDDVDVEVQRRPMHRSDAHDWHLPPHPPTNSSGNLEWEVDVWNIAKLLQTVSQTFDSGEDGPPTLAAAGHRRHELEEQLRRKEQRLRGDDRSDWLSLSYLSLGMFLLNQMDQLLAASPEGVDPQAQAARQRAFASKTTPLDVEPWRYNSLNILLADPKKLAVHEIDRNEGDGTTLSVAMEEVIRSVVANEANATSSSSAAAASRRPTAAYGRLVLNLVKAAHKPKRRGADAGPGIDCVWNAFCIELNHRAALEGIAGSLARVNGVFLKMLMGHDSPHKAIGNLITSLVTWTDLGCQDLFPSCPPTEALNYLVDLATDGQ